MGERIEANLDQMLIDRGYQLMTKDGEDIIYQKDENTQIFVYILNGKVGTDNIKYYIERVKSLKPMGDNTCSHMLLVIDSAPMISATAKQLVDALVTTKRYRIEIFTCGQLSYNPTKSKYVPPHTLYGPAMRQKICSQYSVKPTQLPHIKVTDPIARYYGAQKGDIFRIERPCITMRDDHSISIAYRVVV